MAAAGEFTKYLCTPAFGEICDFYAGDVLQNLNHVFFANKEIRKPKTSKFTTVIDIFFGFHF